MFSVKFIFCFYDNYELVHEKNMKKKLEKTYSKIAGEKFEDAIARCT